MMAKITAHKEEPLSVKFANGKSVNVPAGSSTSVDLTGDEVGKIEATLASQFKTLPHVKVGGGRVEVEERILSDLHPPEGSKKALLRAKARSLGLEGLDGVDYGDLVAKVKAAEADAKVAAKASMVSKASKRGPTPILVVEEETEAEAKIHTATPPPTPRSEEGDEDEEGLESLTVAELRERAKAAGVMGSSSMTKAELVSALEE